MRFSGQIADSLHHHLLATLWANNPQVKGLQSLDPFIHLFSPRYLPVFLSLLMRLCLCLSRCRRRNHCVGTRSAPPTQPAAFHIH